MPIFKKLKATSKKLKPTFCRKLNVMEATNDVAKKTQGIFKRTLKNLAF